MVFWFTFSRSLCFSWSCLFSVSALERACLCWRASSSRLEIRPARQNQQSPVSDFSTQTPPRRAHNIQQTKKCYFKYHYKLTHNPSKKFAGCRFLTHFRIVCTRWFVAGKIGAVLGSLQSVSVFFFVFPAIPWLSKVISLRQNFDSKYVHGSYECYFSNIKGSLEKAVHCRLNYTVLTSSICKCYVCIRWPTTAVWQKSNRKLTQVLTCWNTWRDGADLWVC